jgi:hypothetical protein
VADPVLEREFVIELVLVAAMEGEVDGLHVAEPVPVSVPVMVPDVDGVFEGV